MGVVFKMRLELLKMAWNAYLQTLFVDRSNFHKWSKLIEKITECDQILRTIR